MTYADLDQRDEAKAEFKAAIELDPQDPLARHELAAMLMDEGDYRAAIGLLNEVVRLEPENYEGWLDLGISYAQKGFYQEAERCYVKARELNPDDVLLNYNVAALYSLWDRHPDALAALRKALEKEPAKVRSWLAATPCSTGSRPHRSSSGFSRSTRVPRAGARAIMSSLQARIAFLQSVGEVGGVSSLENKMTRLWHGCRSFCRAEACRPPGERSPPCQSGIEALQFLSPRT